MSRINWMNIATGAVLVISLLFAFLYGWYQWGNAVRANQSQEEVRKQVAMVDQELRDRTEGFKSSLGKVTYPDDPDEDAAFLRNLQVLMIASNVKQVQVDRARVEPLPSIGTASKTDPANATANDPNAVAEASISNLPLGVRAIATTVVVQGQFSSVRLFLYQLQSFRYRSRAININSMQVSMADDKGMLRASLVLTRFVRPGRDTLIPIGAQDSNDPLSGRQSSPAVRMSNPDAPPAATP